MRRWMIILTIAGMFVALLAAPGAAKKEESPAQISLTGEVRYGAIEARTGEYAGDHGPGPGWDHLMNPNFNRCDVDATLTWETKHTYVLRTKETCPPIGKLPVIRAHTKFVYITPGGAVKMAPHPDFPGMLSMIPAITGCDLNGTFPVYHGRFVGERFYASAHYNSICDGGMLWGKFGISAEDGPIHVTYEYDLSVVD